MPAILESLETRRLLASPVALDERFGDAGHAVLPFAEGRLLGLQPDGKIIISRYSPAGAGNELMRLSADGSLDLTFRGGAVRDFGVEGSYDISPTDGRIAYVTRNDALFATKVSVLRSDGTYDPSFDEDGVIDLYDVESRLWGVDRVRWQQGKLVIDLGSDIRRLNPDGSMDSTFGDRGVIRGSTVGGQITLDGEGSIYRLATVRSDPDSGIYDTEIIKHFTRDGAVDTTYSGDGTAQLARTTVGNIDTIAFRVAPDGSVYHFVRILDQARRPALELTVLNPAGSSVLEREYKIQDVDTGDPNFLPYADIRRIHVQPDGRILLIAETPKDTGWAITRLNVDGSIDRSYGDNGSILTDINEFAYFSFPQMLADGDVLLAGKKLIRTGTFEVVRIDSGLPDAPIVSLNAAGALTLKGGDAPDEVSLHLRERDGRLVLRMGTFAQSFAPTKVKRIALFLGGGNDVLAVGAGVKGIYCEGGDGADTLNGGQGGDLLLGGQGSDQLFGLDGDDTLVGGGGNDYLLGGAGKDDVFGNGGIDTLSGAGGNERLFGGPNDSDWINGGAGVDSAAADDKDHFGGVETFLV